MEFLKIRLIETEKTMLVTRDTGWVGWGKERYIGQGYKYFIRQVEGVFQICCSSPSVVCILKIGREMI
jgi:hypothetical protein